jgi:hypothetical protein
MKNEKEIREGLMNHARRIGAQDDLQHLFDKWDRAIALAPPSEKVDMARAAILEVQALLDIHAEDGLTINNEIIIPSTSQGEKK